MDTTTLQNRKDILIAQKADALDAYNFKQASLDRTIKQSQSQKVIAQKQYANQDASFDAQIAAIEKQIADAEAAEASA